MTLSLEDLQFLWFTVFVILLAGYVILDGFDLGVGILHLFSTHDEERRLMLNSIGPVWDGNEVWLVTAGGALFAGFPQMYATLCTSFYVPLMILLAGLIFRAVAIEFRSKQPMPWWRWTWDILFTVASLIIAFALGVVLGTLIHGIPLDEKGEFIGTWRDLLHPYALLVGAMAVAVVTMHGAIYIVMKTEGELHDKMRSWVQPAIIACIVAYAITTMATLIFEPQMIEIMRDRPSLFGIAILNMLALGNIPREIQKGNDGRAFLSSCLNILFLIALFGVGMYPEVVRAVNNPDQLSLTIYNSSSSYKTLGILLTVAAMGVPLVLAYTISIYWIFRGKVKLDATSY